MSCRLRSILPSTNQQLISKAVSYKEVYARRAQRQQHQKRYYDRSAKSLSQLQQGQTIRLQEHGYWKPAAVLQPADTERSYDVRTAEGHEYRRNRQRLLDIKETPNMDKNFECNEQYTQHDLPNTPGKSMEAAAHTAPPYQTRSGRQVKPRVMLDLWINVKGCMRIVALRKEKIYKIKKNLCTLLSYADVL